MADSLHYNTYFTFRCWMNTRYYQTRTTYSIAVSFESLFHTHVSSLEFAKVSLPLWEPAVGTVLLSEDVFFLSPSRKFNDHCLKFKNTTSFTKFSLHCLQSPHITQHGKHMLKVSVLLTIGYHQITKPVVILTHKMDILLSARH